MSITGVAINLTEIQYDGTIEYPCIKDNTRYFAQQIWRYLDASSYYSVSLCLRAIEQMRSPLLRMILANEFLQKINSQQADSPSIALYFKYLVNEKWKQFLPENPPETVSTCDRFPFLDKRKQRKAAHDIGRPQYLNLLLVAFRTYMEVFPLKIYYQDLNPQPEPAVSRSPNSSGQSCTKTTDSNTLKNQIDLESMEKKIKKLVKKFTRSATTVVRHSADGPAFEPLVLEEISVPLTLLLRYRDDVKHLLLIHRWLRTKGRASEEYRSLFEPWRRYLATIDETLVCE